MKAIYPTRKKPIYSNRKSIDRDERGNDTDQVWEKVHLHLQHETHYFNLFKHPYKLKESKTQMRFPLPVDLHSKAKKIRIFNGENYDLRLKYWIPRSRNIEIRMD
jgi:hypothetical protein